MSVAPKAKSKKKKNKKVSLHVAPESHWSERLQELHKPAQPDHWWWIVDAAEKLQFCRDDAIRIIAARRFLRYAPEITSHVQHFAGTLSLAVAGDENINVRKISADALGALGPASRSYADSLERALLHDVNEQVREAAATALAAMGKESASFPQTEALHFAVLYDSRPSVRSAASRALAVFDVAAADAFDALGREALEGVEPVMRCRALACFACCGEKAGPYSPILATAAVCDSSVGVRQAAASALETLGDVAKPGLVQLVAALQDEDPLRRKAAVRALAIIGYEPPPASPRHGLADDEDWGSPTHKRRKSISQRRKSMSMTKKRNSMAAQPTDSQPSSRKSSKSPSSRKSSKSLSQSPRKLDDASEDAAAKMQGSAPRKASPKKGSLTKTADTASQENQEGSTSSPPKKPLQNTSKSPGKSKPPEEVSEEGGSGKKKRSPRKSSAKKAADVVLEEVPAQGGGRSRGCLQGRSSMAGVCVQTRQEAPPPPTPPPLLRAGVKLATMALSDTDLLVRYRAGEALSSFGRAVAPAVRAMAQTTMRDDNPEARSRASEALGASTSDDWRAVHAKTFSELLGTPSRPTTASRPASRCCTADIIRQGRAVAALRDLGTAAKPHRKTLEALSGKSESRQGSRDPGVRASARSALFVLDNYTCSPWRRRVATPLPLDVLRRTMADLRSEAASQVLQARCSTAAGQRSEDVLFMRAKFMGAVETSP